MPWIAIAHSLLAPGQPSLAGYLQKWSVDWFWLGCLWLACAGFVADGLARARELPWHE